MQTSLASRTNVNVEQAQYCGFRIANDHFAVPVLEVQEVIRPQRLTSIPLSERTIRGLINLRGQIVTAINLRHLFGLDANYGREYMNVIVRSGDSLTALMVDEIQDVIEAQPDTFQPTPETLDAKLKPFVKGVHKLDKQLLIVLDLKKIMDLGK